MSAEFVAALVPILSAGVAGWFAVLARKSHNRSPESVAGGYSSLVGDLRVEMQRLAARVEDLERERKQLHSHVGDLQKQVTWLLDNVGDDDRLLFDAYFRKKT